MKKVFVLLFSLGAVTAVFAQKRESRDVVLGQTNRNVYNNNHYDDGFYSTRDRDAQIAQIKRQYDWKIASVKRDRYLRNAEKKRQVRFLERERDEKIREVWQRYSQRNNGRRYGRY